MDEPIVVTKKKKFNKRLLKESGLSVDVDSVQVEITHTEIDELVLEHVCKKLGMPVSDIKEVVGSQISSQKWTLYL